VIEPVGEAHGGQFRFGAGKGIGHARQFHRRGDILARGHRGQQVERLQDNADPPAPRGGEAILVERGKILARNHQGAPGCALQPGKHGQQRRLARAGGAEQGDGLAGHDGQVDPLENVDAGTVLAQRQGEGAGGDERGLLGHGAGVAQAASPLQQTIPSTT
jgi:hypothetical protein